MTFCQRPTSTSGRRSGSFERGCSNDQRKKRSFWLLLSLLFSTILYLPFPPSFCTDLMSPLAELPQSYGPSRAAHAPTPGGRRCRGTKGNSNFCDLSHRSEDKSAQGSFHLASSLAISKVKVQGEIGLFSTYRSLQPRSAFCLHLSRTFLKYLALA